MLNVHRSTSRDAMTLTRSSMPRRKKAGVVLVHNNKILLVRQKYRDKEGKWGFPKGSLMRGESEKRCAFRELHEETGIELEKYRPKLIGRLSKNNTKHLYYEGVFYVYQLREPLRETNINIPENHPEIQAVKWVTLKQAKRLKGNWTLRPILKCIETTSLFAHPKQ